MSEHIEEPDTIRNELMDNGVLSGGQMSMAEREKAARAIGYLEGLSTWLWAHVGEDLADESVNYYDRQVEILHKVIFEEAMCDE